MVKMKCNYLYFSEMNNTYPCIFHFWTGTSNWINHYQIKKKRKFYLKSICFIGITVFFMLIGAGCSTAGDRLFVEKILADNTEIIKQDFKTEVRGIVQEELKLVHTELSTVKDEMGDKDFFDYFQYIISAGLVTFIGVKEAKNRGKKDDTAA